MAVLLSLSLAVNPVLYCSKVNCVADFQPEQNSLLLPQSDTKLLDQKRHILEPKPESGDIMSNIDFIAEEANKANSTLVVCNHVPTAQQVYKELKKRVEDTVLLHSQFMRGDRSRIENELGKRLPKVLVSTQVVEVSLDLDFEQGFTEPAPIDAIVQRMGRVNRRGKITTGAKVRIFEKQFSKYNKPYAKELRDSSLRVLSSLPNPLREEDLNRAADEVYGSGYTGEDLIKYNDGLECISIEDVIAGTNRKWNDDIIQKNEGSVELLPNTKGFLDEFNAKRKQYRIIEAFGLVVPVGKWRLQYLFKNIDQNHDPWILNNCDYSKDIGLEFLT